MVEWRLHIREAGLNWNLSTSSSILFRSSLLPKKTPNNFIVLLWDQIRKNSQKSSVEITTNHHTTNIQNTINICVRYLFCCCYIFLSKLRRNNFFATNSNQTFLMMSSILLLSVFFFQFRCFSLIFRIVFVDSFTIRSKLRVDRKTAIELQFSEQRIWTFLLLKMKIYFPREMIIWWKQIKVARLTIPF